MKPKAWMTACLLLVVFASLSVAATHGSTTPPKLPANFYRLSGPDAVREMPVTVVDPNPESVRLRFTDPPLEFGTVTLNGADYSTVRLSGEASTLDPGAPDLPTVHRMAMIGNTGDVALTVVNQSFTVQTFDHDISPVQLLEGSEGAPIDGFSSPLASIYTEDRWYPANIAEVSDPAAVRDVRFVVVSAYPVQINPVTHQMRVYNSIDVMVSNTGGVGASEIHITPTSISPDFKKIYRQFENFDGSALDALPVLPGKYLVVCPNIAAAITQAQNLVTWKKRRGLDAVYATTAETGTTASAIRTYINNLYTSSNGQLESVCLLGDVTGTYAIPTGTTSGGEYDNYYGKLINNAGENPDPVPDVAIGRLTAIDDNSLASVVAKSINYESNPYMTNTTWFTSGWCAAHTAHIPSNATTKAYTREIMLQHGINPVAWNVYSGGMSTTDLNSHLQSGISVFNHRMSWVSETVTGTVDAINAYPMTPFVMAVTCGTGDFDGDAVSEHWLRPSGQTPSNPKGAIGCVGVATTSTHVPYNNIIDAGVMYGLYVLDIQSQGAALVAGKLELYRNYHVSHPTETTSFSNWNNLMGDPAVAIWRYRPVIANVTKPASINRGANNVAITVINSETSAPVKDAFVCLLKGTETFSRGYTNASGQINLPCSTATTGYMQVTITRENLKAYIDSIQVVSGTATLALNSVTVDDDNIGGTIGDNNHVLNPGETVDLVINLANTGTTTTVTGITGTLTTASPGVQITSGISAYPNLAPGSNANPTTSFRVVVTSVFDNEPATFFLNLASSIGTQTVRVDLTPRAPNIVYVSQAFSGPGGNVNPGEEGDFTVTMRNSGARTMVSSTGILRSLDPFVQVTDSIGTFGTIASNGTGTNSTDRFHIVVNGGAFNGHRTVMQLVMTDANGFRDSTVFDSSHFFQSDTTLFTPNAANFYITTGPAVSTSPTGPDERGYYAYDNSETQPSGSGSTYQWVELHPGSGTSLNFNDTAEDGDQSSVLNLPFNFTFYGRAFNQITVCTNGWLSFGSSTQVDFRNYRMGSPIGPPNIVAAYWDDLKAWGADNNVYWYYNSTEHYYAVEWKVQTLWTSVDEIFEVLLYDPSYYPTARGDGKIKVQYNTVNLSANQDNSGNDNYYATVGIENADHSTGIDYYYWNVYSPCSASLVNGRSIMFTTDGNGQLNPSVTVVQPRGSEQWYVGQVYDLLWTTTAVQGNINIALNRNYPSGTWETLFSNIPNSSSQAWTVTGPATSSARIRMTSVTNPAVGDTCAANFTIIMPTATLLTPNGGELYPTGGAATVSWTSTGLGPVRVEFNRNYPSATWELISASASADFDWTVTGPPTNSARIRITGISVPAVGDTSNANFTIGIPPVITHTPHADQNLGPVLFTAHVTDDVPGFTPKVFYRLVNAVSYDSLPLVATGYPTEYAATTPVLSAGSYEYYFRATDAQFLSTYLPASGTYRMNVAAIGGGWLAYDDSVAERYNWVDGEGFKWAVKFDPGTYPFALTAGRFAICPTNPTGSHWPILFQVISADGPGGLPGTILFSDTTGVAGNTVGGLPAGAAWADVVTRTNGQSLQINSPFYLSVGNQEPRSNPVAFAEDTTSTRSHQSYVYDNCDHNWYNEDGGHLSNRPGNRMIRANGFPLGPLQVVIYKADSATVSSSVMRWTSVGAPFYHVYTSTNATGPFDTMIGSVAGPATGQVVTYTDTNAINLGVRRYYRVFAADVP
ncbi:MAG TPA: C25 family cysteine peptidase [bacterium]|jgi:hypothetical protein